MSVRRSKSSNTEFIHRKTMNYWTVVREYLVRDSSDIFQLIAQSSKIFELFRQITPILIIIPTHVYFICFQEVKLLP